MPEPAGPTAAIVAVVVAYFAILVGIGWWASRESRSVKGFYVAGKKLPSWVIAFSSNTTGESGWLLLGLTGMGYLVGFHALWVVLGEVLGVALAWTVVARPFKEFTDRYDAITVPDYLTDRFADRRHVIRIVSAIIIFTMVGAYTARAAHRHRQGVLVVHRDQLRGRGVHRSRRHPPLHEHRRLQGGRLQRRAPGRAHVPLPADPADRGDLARGRLGRDGGRRGGGGSRARPADGGARPDRVGGDERGQLRGDRAGLPGRAAAPDALHVGPQPGPDLAGRGCSRSSASWSSTSARC